jgi:hypothetical protein
VSSSCSRISSTGVTDRVEEDHPHTDCRHAYLMENGELYGRPNGTPPVTVSTGFR